ncbi:hypothetical protein [Pelagerythrobacter aerophilus]
MKARKSEENQGRKANGAGIAADPTLTDAWSSVLAEPFAEALGAGVSAAVRRTGPLASVTGARAGIRFRRAASAGPKTFPQPLGSSATGRTVLAGDLERFRAGSHLRSSSTSDRIVRPRDGIAFASFSSGALASGRNLLQVSLEDRADSFRHVEMVWKVSMFSGR